MRVLELTNNPQVDAHALKECLELDPALTGKILRVVNSSLFGLTREVSDLNQALALLGTKPLKLLVLGFSLPAGLFAGLSGEMLGRYWRRTLTKAVAARELSETVWKVSGDEPFIAGLLQDVGMLLLIQELGAAYVNFLDKVTGCGKDLLAMETESLGFDHTRLSARMLEHWGLPAALIDAIAWRPDGQTGADAGAALPKIVHLAELLCRLLVDGRAAALEEVLDLGWRYRDLTEPQIEELVSHLDEKVRGLADVLSLQLPSGVDYESVLVAAQSQLAEVASSAAEELIGREQRNTSGQQSAAVLSELESLSQTLRETSVAPRPAAMPIQAPSHEAPVARQETPARPGRAVYESHTEASDLAAPGLIGAIDFAVAACRQSRCSLSLVLVEINHIDRLLITRGLGGVELMRRLLAVLCRKLDHPDMRCIPFGEGGYALILPDCDRAQAASLGNQLIGAVRHSSIARSANLEIGFDISVGASTVALPPKNFRCEDLIESASRCLYGSRASGGSVVKSIET
jgi:HD-like signal output (HDOD) protein